MSPYIFNLSDIGEGVAEAEIVKWHVGAGERIEEDAPLLDVMTDKATVEITSPVSGRVISTHGEAGKLVPVGSLLVEIEMSNESAEPQRLATPKALATSPLAEFAPSSSPPARAAVEQTFQHVQAPAALTGEDVRRTILASPAVRRHAYERGIPLQFARGSGPAGRILLSDLDADSVVSPRAADMLGLAERKDVTETKIVGARRLIAEKMQAAKRHIPHFSYIEELDLTELDGLRMELNGDRSADQPNLTFLPFFMRATVILAGEFPQINARYDDDAGIVRSYGAVHIGIATRTAAGLMVPVVRHAEARDLWSCAAEMERVTSAARAGTATRDELSGSTITITSLGVLGGIAATPIINHPEVAIIGPNKLVERPVVRNGRIVIRKIMNLSSSFDHRIVDGYEAARFVQRFRRLTERPALLFAGQR
jgi:2-oxoisovalerate dehydrogenase E2 component (dihydrolipoyl transacylase)